MDKETGCFLFVIDAELLDLRVIDILKVEGTIVTTTAMITGYPNYQ